MRYTVGYYDSLVTIATKFGVPIEAIIYANGLIHDYVYPGQVIWIPVKVKNNHHLIKQPIHGLAPFGLHPYYD